MIFKVKMETMTDIRKVVAAAEKAPCEVDLCAGRYVVNAKSMLGVMSLPGLFEADLLVHSEDWTECGKIRQELSEAGLLAEEDEDAVKENEKEYEYDITTFGEILIDFTDQGAGENGQKLFAQNPGGAPANVAVAARRLGARTAFMGKVGMDMHGQFLKKVLEEEQVETKGMILDEKYFTTLAFVSISESGERTFSFSRKPGADTQITKEELAEELLAGTKIFHVGSLSLTDEPARETTFYAVKTAKEHGSMISYDPNYRASLWKDEETAKEHMRSLVPYADIMKISDEETALLTDIAEVEAAAAKLCSQGVKVAAVTLGSEGTYVCCKDGGVRVPGFPSKVADTNGAGDSFWGGFLYKVSTGGKSLDELTLEDLQEYARFGNAVASLCVQKKGAIPAMPQLAQVEEQLKN